MKTKTFSLAVIIGLSTCFLASGQPSNNALQGVLDDITVGGPSSVNVATDYLADSADSAWAIGASGTSAAQIIIELAGYAPNTSLGVYDTSDPTKMVQLFAGADGAGAKSSVGLGGLTASGYEVEVKLTGTGVYFADNNMGIYINVGSTGNTYYSNTALNADGVDHMYAYQGVGDTVDLPGSPEGIWGSNEYILGFEDVYGGGDRDYTDMVVMIESISPVPVPGAVLLGALGLSAAGWKLRRKED